MTPPTAPAPGPNPPLGARILVVDDTPQNLALMSELLRPLYHVTVANHGERALHLLAQGDLPDLILLDIMMPGIDGYEVLRRLRLAPRTQHIPVIFLTAKSETEDEAQGLALGAQDYITKPICAPIVLARVAAQLKLKVVADFLRDKADYLESEVQRRTERIEAIQDITVLVMSSMAESRDNETGNHIRRTQHYVKGLAEALASNPQFASDLTPDTIELLYKSAPLHDIGKVGIPDHILLKPGKLTPEEFEVMKTHTTIGYESIVRAERLLGEEVDFLRFAKEISLSHQEKWDGSGYPQGLKGEAIPLSARLMAVADVYDALISRRVYKEAFSHGTAVAILQEGRGTHFDPVILDAFLQIQDQFIAIAARWVDE
ncbi:HD-GYP domain-containing protein [Inhella gelatinilytica]|uniref:Two-component system response regulator n=1 Tax=Inhella gelatinilytica TaxID=2795030 RepID=A0A931IZV8_9BURK|nr:two-component system response regulator [Inhella gelatinilytica]MBH9553618.1 two-component system response regulator [Inhella gelatinilytica]